MNAEKNKVVNESTLINIEKSLYKYAVYKIDYEKFKQIFKDVSFVDNSSQKFDELTLFFENNIKDAYQEYSSAVLDLVAAVKMEWNVINKHLSTIMNGFNFLCSNYVSSKNKSAYIAIGQEEIQKVYNVIMKGLTNYELFKDTNKTQKTV
ncbi:hypothetical protein ACNQ2O_01305 [Mycoplasma sp. AA7A]|uniref:hypothetical protein n=1 Tax=Mycoplasma sp. AA7A TaxID=3401665 RepID=UPI003AAB6AD5